MQMYRCNGYVCTTESLVDTMDLIINNLSFGYNRDQLVLDRISCHMKGPSVLAIVGGSGSGKSTLLRLISGILQKGRTNHLEGTIEINKLSPDQFTKLGKLGFMFQEPTLFPNLTVRKNIALPLKFRKEKKEETVENLINIVGLSAYANYLPAQLSGGMKTRVALARTFVTNPQLLLLDEPFSALDIRWKFLLYRELETLRVNHSSSVIVVSHDIQEALLLSNHILVFGKDGKILSELKINKPLPRVFDPSSMQDLQKEFVEIQRLILEN